MWKKLGIGLSSVLLVAVVAIQFVPVDRSNPPVTATVPAPEGALDVLRRSCFDCHSNETTWPFYSRVAPASWLVARDVRLGREALNFSEWDRYSQEQRAELVADCYEETVEGEMPMSIYVLMHPDAKVSAADHQALREWALSLGGSVSGEEDDDD